MERYEQERVAGSQHTERMTDHAPSRFDGTILRPLVAIIAGFGSLAMGVWLSPGVTEFANARGGLAGRDSAELVLLVLLGVIAGAAVGGIAHVREHFSATIVLMAFIALAVVGIAMAMVEAGDPVAIRRNVISGASGVVAYALSVTAWKLIRWRRDQRRSTGELPRECVHRPERFQGRRLS